MLAANASLPRRLPNALELHELVRAATRAAVDDGIPLVVLSADFGRVVTEAMFGDPTATEVARAMARGAEREYGAIEAARLGRG
jgi:hypothetical protein